MISETLAEATPSLSIEPWKVLAAAVADPAKVVAS